MEYRKEMFLKQSRAVKAVGLFFSVSFFAGALASARILGKGAEVFAEWLQILFSPCPLVTDYFLLGSLPAALFNAGVCGLACSGLMVFLKAECRVSTMAGFFLVVAHCFYGLNFLNMWPPILGILLFCRVMKIRFRDNLDMAMFSTAFAPFVSELLFRYTQGETFLGVFLVCVMSVFLGFAIPAMLPGALKMHKGYNLYNGGLAFGLLGLFLYAFMYPTMGMNASGPLPLSGAVYETGGMWFLWFATAFFGAVFGICLLAGWYLNGKNFRRYSELLGRSGHQEDFLDEFGAPLVLINLGFYGLMVLAYMDGVILLTGGSGFTGATFGVTLAAMTFAAGGQHPGNVWPILAGFAALSAFVMLVSLLGGRPIPWTLSVQGYLNGAAFATGLCPFAGKYGWKAGVAAGAMCAVMCTSTGAIHGGFVLYNGGLTAGITALILRPCLEYYYPEK